MENRVVAMVLSLMCAGVLIGSCSKDNSPNSPPQQSAPSLKTTASSVSVTSGQVQNVTISGGTPAYSISSPPNAALASASLENARNDTITLVIVGGVSTATGSSAVVVRDNSSTPKQVSISIVKQ
jgi:hypothetical protein